MARSDGLCLQYEGFWSDFATGTPARGLSHGWFAVCDPGRVGLLGRRLRSLHCRDALGSDAKALCCARPHLPQKRLPSTALRDRLDLTPADLGLVLLAIAAGSVIALPISGLIIARLHSRLTTTVMAVVLVVALTIVATGYLAGVGLVLIGLFLLGFAPGDR